MTARLFMAAQTKAIQTIQRLLERCSYSIEGSTDSLILAHDGLCT